MAMVVPYDVRAANHAADDAADDRAGRAASINTKIPVLITERMAISLVELN
jgi:hypothetical protein